jgi:RND family efflux transporter MFP subunit
MRRRSSFAGRRSRLILAGVLGLVTAHAALAAGDDTPVVRIARIRQITVNQDVEATGVTQPDHTLVLAFKTAGVIRSIAVNVGDHVRKGQLLAELDPRDLDAALRQASDNHDRAARDLKRYEKLRRQGAISETLYEQQRALESTTSAALAAAEADRAYGRLTAPADGMILARTAEPLSVVAPGISVLSMSNDTQADVLRAGISDRDVLVLSLRDPATIRYSALPGRNFRAHVSEIGRLADSRTGQFAVKLALENGQGRLPDGLVGEARIVPARHARQAIVIPASALVDASGSDGNIVIADPGRGIAHRRHVATGEILDGEIEILSGAKPGEWVVTDGANWLDEGQHFRTVPGDRQP